MANVRENIQDQASGMIDRTRQLGDKFESASRDIGERLGEMAGEVSERATDYMENTRKYVKTNPIQSVMIAAATGAIVGNIFGMISRRRH